VAAGRGGEIKVEIDATLVRRLIGAQFPHWASLPVRLVERGGNDNRTFHLGEEMSARLPSAPAYAAQVEKEHRWLPFLAPRLPLPIPRPVALGAPSTDYPLPWSVYRWLDGETASRETIADLPRFAADVAAFLEALQRIDARGGPPSGAHCFHRGGSLAIYDSETHEALAVLGARVDADACRAVWRAAMASEWNKPPVWVHGDIAIGNLLVKDGALSAVIDFGCSCVGDPACDLAIAWMLFDGQSRETFRAALPLDDATWARGRGWTLWKALKVLSYAENENGRRAREHRRALEGVLADHKQSA
jgi:aminoglycoside phosphotransferase (APT) family kinase protein